MRGTLAWDDRGEERADRAYGYDMTRRRMMEGRRVQEDLNRRSDGFSKSHPTDQYNQIRQVNKSYETPWGDDDNY